jgi:hypothetical protein
MDTMIIMGMVTHTVIPTTIIHLMMTTMIIMDTAMGMDTVMMTAIIMVMTMT